ncbi:MAG: putative DNA binding domain-containing protein [Acholeplasmatales bacterium]|nr:putative DNA binding domain-containing protein [Acholeplasmatales bacterium]
MINPIKSEELTQSEFETVVAFLNTIGGYIFLGVSDNGTIVGVDEDSASTIKTNFANSMNNNEKINPSMPLMLQEAYIDSKLVLYVYIPESSEVHKLNSKYIYIRTEEGDKDITNNQYALKKLYVRKSGDHFEDKVYHDLTIDDFDMDTVTYAKKLSILNDEHSNWKNLSNEDILKTFYKQDSTTGEYGYTNAALLLFGKSESITNKISWYKVDVLKRFNDLERYDDRFTCEDNLIKSYDEIIKYILDKIDQPFYLSPNGVTYNAVNVVVRELVSNVLIHRDFLDATGTQILLYRDAYLMQIIMCIKRGEVGRELP